MKPFLSLASFCVVSMLLPFGGEAAETTQAFEFTWVGREQRYLWGDLGLGTLQSCDIAEQRRALSAMAYRSGDYGKSFFLDLDSASIFRTLPSHNSAPWVNGWTEIIRNSAVALSFAGHDQTAFQLLESFIADENVETDFPTLVDELAKLGSYLDEIESRDNRSQIPARAIALGYADDVCANANRPFVVGDWEEGAQSLNYLFSEDVPAFRRASKEYRRRRFISAAFLYLKVLDEEVYGSLNSGFYDPSLIRSSIYYCSAQAFYRSGERSRGLGALCPFVSLETESESLFLLTNSIQQLAGRNGQSVREICGVYPSRSNIRSTAFPLWDWPFVDPGEYAVPAYSDQFEIHKVLSKLATTNTYDAAGTAFLAMGISLLLSPEDNRWQPANSGCRGRCRGFGHTNREGQVWHWLIEAAAAFQNVGGPFHAYDEFERISRNFSALFEFLGPGFFYHIYGSYCDPSRSLLREGLDIERLSTSRFEPILYDNFPSLKSEWFPKDSDSKQADEQFGRAQSKHQAGDLAGAAADFFRAAATLDMNCNTDLCRDGLWVWRAHAVWNAVTSLRQMGNPVKACEEAKKFVILAGEGHQKSAAADVEDALCSDLPEHVSDGEEIN